MERELSKPARPSPVMHRTGRVGRCAQGPSSAYNDMPKSMRGPDRHILTCLDILQPDTFLVRLYACGVDLVDLELCAQ